MTEPDHLHAVPAPTAAERMASLREQLAALVLVNVDDALEAARVAAERLADVAECPGPQGLRDRARRLAEHLRLEVLGLRAIRERL